MVSRWFCAGNVATATFAIPCAAMVVITVAAHVGGAIAVGQTRYAVIVMRPAYVAMVSMRARAVDVMVTTAAVPCAAIIVIGAAANVNGTVAMRESCEYCAT